MRQIGWGIILLALCWLAGCHSSPGMPMEEIDQEPPVLRDFAITSPATAWRGGPCQVRVTATDNDAVAEVYARISGPGASGDKIPLSLVTPGQAFYQGTGTVPPNTNGDGRANTYYITVWAVDKSGIPASTQSLSFVVPAAEAPLPPPSEW